MSFLSYANQQNHSLGHVISLSTNPKERDTTHVMPVHIITYVFMSFHINMSIQLRPPKTIKFYTTTTCTTIITTDRGAMVYCRWSLSG